MNQRDGESMTSADAAGVVDPPYPYTDDENELTLHVEDKRYPSTSSSSGHRQAAQRPISTSESAVGSQVGTENGNAGLDMNSTRQSSVRFSTPPSFPVGTGPGGNDMTFSSSSAAATSRRATAQPSGEEHTGESSSADEITPIFIRAGSKGGGGGGGVGGAGAARAYKTQESLKSGSGESGIGRRMGSSSSRGGMSARTRGSGGGGAGLERELETMDRRDRELWWKKMTQKYGTVELVNKGSVARDHLALERTFLAWLRTSLAFASIGIAVTQLFRLNTTISDRHPSSSSSSPPLPHPPTISLTTSAGHLRQVGKPLGATFLGIAIVVLFVGFHRYFESQHWIIRGKFPASRGSVALVALVAGLLIVVSLVVVVAVDPSVFER